MITSTNIGRAVKILRNSSRLTQDEFAKKLEKNGWGIKPSQNYISRIESGLKALSIEKLNIIAETLKVKLSFLIEQAERQ